MRYKPGIIILAFTIFFIMQFLSPPALLSPEGYKIVSCALLMIVLWLTEAIPIPAAALLPIVLFPVLGIDDIGNVAANYGNSIVFLFMGGFILALSLEKWGLHRRLALGIIGLTGGGPTGILVGFTIATAFLSMWISNTATAVIMLPMAISVMALVGTSSEAQSKNFFISLTLLIAYAANIGGMATLIGTPPNIVLKGLAETVLQKEIGFAEWLLVAFPISAVMLAVTFSIVVFVLYPSKLGKMEGLKGVIQNSYKELGPVGFEEKMVALVFLLTATGWMFRIPFNNLLQNDYLNDTNIALSGALLLFMIPAKGKESRFLMEWKDMVKLPWGILILFGGGLALAAAMEKTGIILAIGVWVGSLDITGGLVLIFIVTALMLFMTELMSNVALCTVFLPLVIGIANAFEMPAMHMLVPVTLASSCAFMLPMGTPPNAIVFASGNLRILDMVRAGLPLNLLSIVIIVLLSNWLVKFIV
ncbi:MAG: SLC13 family permease [Cytophagaceae bacterium]